MARTVLSVAEEELTLVWLMQLGFARLVLRVTGLLRHCPRPRQQKREDASMLARATCPSPRRGRAICLRRHVQQPHQLI
jgi:hypothetical protein